jgi:hypothetical protein
VHSYHDGLDTHLLREHGLDLVTHSYFPPHRQRIVVNPASQNVGMLRDLDHLEPASQSLGLDKEQFICLVHVHDDNGQANKHGAVTKNSWCLDIPGGDCLLKVKMLTGDCGRSTDRVAAPVRLLEKTPESHRR